MRKIILNFLHKMVCLHDWVEIKTISTYEDAHSSRPFKTTYLYKCNECGKFKRIVIK